MTASATLAAALAAVLDPAVSTFDAPPETMLAPAVVIRPSDPYQAPATAAGPAAASYRFDIDLIVSRTDERLGLRLLEYGRDQISDALPAGWWWVTFGNIGELEVAGRLYLRGTLTVATILIDAP